MKIYQAILSITAFAAAAAQETSCPTLREFCSTDAAYSTVWRDVLQHSVANAMLGNAPDAEEKCFDSLASSESSNLRTWADKKFDDLFFEFGDEESFGKLLELFSFNPTGCFSILDLPLYRTIFFRNEVDVNEYYFVDGSRTMEIEGVFDDLKSFWDISSDDILLMGMHGSQLTMASIFQLYRAAFDESEDDATVQEAAEYVYNLINETIGFDHPFLTLNAVAFYSEDDCDLPDRIILGEGVLEYMNDVGLGLDGPDFVLAHEFGHHLQYENDPISTSEIVTPERTRRGELMADASAGYYLSHPSGGHLDKEMIEEVYATAMASGDCNFDNDGHHGTPAQRERAVMWGAKLVRKEKTKTKQSGKKGAKHEEQMNSATIFPSESFGEICDLSLPLIVNPDICAYRHIHERSLS